MTLLKKRSSGSGSGNQAPPQHPVAPTGSKLDTNQIVYYDAREQGTLNFDHILLDEIDPDPSNHRTRDIDPRPLLSKLPKFLIIDPEYSGYDRQAVADFDANMAQAVEELCQSDPALIEVRTRLFEKLIPLRDSIRRFGVKVPIEVKRVGRRYSIVYGHRRYFASILAGERKIPTRIVSEEYDLVKRNQATENLHQEGLSLPGKLHAIEAALKEAGLSLASKRTIAADILGMDRTGIGRYMDVLQHGSPYLHQLIENGIVTNFIHAAKYAKMADEDIKKAIESGNSIKETSEKKGEKLAQKKKGRGRSITYIKTPKIKDTNVIHAIMKKFESTKLVANWDDKEQVNQAWESFINSLIKECQKED